VGGVQEGPPEGAAPGGALFGAEAKDGMKAPAVATVAVGGLTIARMLRRVLGPGPSGGRGWGVEESVGSNVCFSISCMFPL